MIHAIKGCGVVNTADVVVFPELSCFLWLNSLEIKCLLTQRCFRMKHRDNGASQVALVVKNHLQAMQEMQEMRVQSLDQEEPLE